MSGFEIQDLPPDIFNLAFIEKDPDLHLEDVIPHVDLARNGGVHQLPVIRVGRPRQTGRGQTADAKDGDGLEGAIGLAFHARFLSTWYALRASGKSQPQVLEILISTLNKPVDFDFTPMLKLGRKRCTSYYNVQSKEALEEKIIEFYSKSVDGGSVMEAINGELRYLKALSRAYVRVELQNKDLYRNLSLKRDKKYIDSVVDSELNVPSQGKPKSAVDGLLVAITAGVDPSPLWGQYAYFSYIFQCAIPLSNHLRGFPGGFKAQQLYTLHRLCTLEFSQSLRNQNNIPHSAIGCQAILRGMVERIFGLERFISNARTALEGIGISAPLQISAVEIEYSLGRLDERIMFCIP